MSWESSDWHSPIFVRASVIFWRTSISVGIIMKLLAWRLSLLVSDLYIWLNWFDGCADEHSKRHKKNMILKALGASPPDVATLRQLAISRGGLLDDCLRRRAWPCLLDIDVQSIPPKPGHICSVPFITLHAKLRGAVYCYRSCLWQAVFVGGYVTTITRNCMHRSSLNWVCR